MGSFRWLFFLLLVIASGGIAAQTCDCPPANACGACSGGLTTLTLKSLAASTVSVTAEDNSGVFYTGTLAPSEEFTLNGTLSNGKFQGPTVTVKIASVTNALISANCSSPVFVGDTYGSFKVIAGASQSGGVLCCSPTATETVPPVISNCPGDISQVLGPSLCTKGVSWTVPTATDNCGLASFTSNHNPGEQFPSGVTMVTYTATDSYGNTATCSFNVVISDNEAPKFTSCPADINISSGVGCETTVTWDQPAVTDNCSVNSVTSNIAPGATFPVGQTVVTYTATDGSGNQSICSFTVTVGSTVSPVLSNCPTDIIEEVDKKGIAFAELSANDLPVKNIKVNDNSLEPASWNYSKGVLEVVIRKKSYRVVTLSVQYVDGKPAPSVRVTYQGQQEMRAASDNQGKIELPLPLNENILEKTQFKVDGHRVVELLGGDLQRLVVELVPKESPITQTQSTTGSAIKLDVKSLDNVKSLSELFSSMGGYTQLSEADRKQLDEKFAQLFAEAKDSIIQRQPYLDKISNTSYVNEDIKNLLNQVGSEDRLLQQQREEFNDKIAVIESKLNSGFSTLSQLERKGLLNDLNALESLLSENESRFFENHNDYRQIINGLKEKYFDVVRLESQLSESESKRLQEQQLFREQMLIAAGVLALLSAAALLLVYFSNRLRKQKKQLIKANNEVIQMNENLEEMVNQRTTMLREANEELDTFLYRASHDLRSPLCSIKGLVNISPYLTKDELIDKVGDTMHNMDRLLEKLEMVSEIAGSERHTRVKVIDIIKKVEYRFSDFIVKYNELFVIDCPTDLEIISDENLLESIINNLVENAVYFGAVENRRRPEVRVNASFRDQNLILSVYDNGVGIDREVRDRIYNMFFKGHIKSCGHGLGLYIVNKAVQALHGSIVFETQPLQYTLFLVTIPVKQAVRQPHMAVAS